MENLPAGAARAARWSAIWLAVLFGLLAIFALTPTLFALTSWRALEPLVIADMLLVGPVSLAMLLAGWLARRRGVDSSFPRVYKETRVAIALGLFFLSMYLAFALGLAVIAILDHLSA